MTMNRKVVNKTLNREISNQFSNLACPLNKRAETLMEYLKPGIVNHLLKNSSLCDLDKDCVKITTDTITGLTMSAVIIGTSPQKPYCQCGRHTTVQTVCDDDNVHVFQEDRKQSIKREKNRIKKMKKREQKSNVTDAFKKIINDDNDDICDSFQEKLQNLDTMCKNARDILTQDQKLFESVQNNTYCVDVNSKLHDLQSSLLLLENKVHKMVEIKNELSKMDTENRLPQPVKKIVLSKYYDVTLLAKKQKLLSENSKILCTRFEISKLIPKKCTCKKKHLCKIYFHETTLEDSMYYSFMEKNNTSKNERLTKIIEQLETIMLEKDDYNFEFYVGNESYNIEFVWAQNDIVYLIQSNVFIDNETKHLFNKRWIKITI